MAATEIQQGVARVYGMQGAAVTTLTGTAYITLESGDLEQQFDFEEIKAQDGDVETIIGSNEHYDVTLTFAPTGNSGGTNTRAQAISSAANSIPAIITKVVLATFDIAAYNGNWNALPGTSIRMGRDQVVTMTMRLRKYINNNSTLTAGVLS